MPITTILEVQIFLLQMGLHADFASEVDEMRATKQQNLLALRVGGHYEIHEVVELKSTGVLANML